MSQGSYVRAAAALLAGGALTGAEYWGLLNVPESNVPALGLSAALALLMVLTAGVTVGFACVCSQGLSMADAVRRAVLALPLFVVGLMIFAALWAATTAFDGWWFRHRGEADAVALRYFGFTRTAAIHTAIAWLSWLVRWAGGLSVVAGLVAVATLGGPGHLVRGLRVSLKPVPLAAIVAGVLLAVEVLWRAAFLRPTRLPATGVEMYFAGAKLALLSLAAAAIAAAVVAVYGRAAARS